MASRDDHHDDPSVEWSRVQGVLERALELAPGERTRFVDEACGSDGALRAEVERLLETEHDSVFLMPPHEAARAVSGAAAAPSAGDAVGDYRLVRELGVGGMGAVWLARRAGEFEQRVAIKLVREGLDSRAVLERFRRERQVLAGLEHPNIARLIDGGSLPGGRPYLVMEYVEGTRIDQYCDERRLGLAARLALFVRMTDAVEHAHRKLVVHRDIKPHNVLVTADGTPKLLDFGIAKVLAEDEGVETAPTLGGMTPLTPRYASPEQVEGRPVTTASDVYSLGVTLYELLTGRSPYDDTTSSVALVRAVCDEEPARPSAVVAELEPADLRAKFGREATPRALRQAMADDLDWVLACTLRKEPERRYPSVERFADDLRRYLAGRPVAARPESWRYVAKKAVRRNPTAVMGAALAVLALVAATVVSLLAAARAERAAERERLERIGSEEALEVLQTAIFTPSVDLGAGMDARVRDLLGGVEARLDELRSPNVKARLQLMLAATYIDLGRYASGEALSRAALAVLDGELESDELRIAALEQLGVSLYYQHREREAIAAWEEGLALFERPAIAALVATSETNQLVAGRINMLQAIASAWGDEGELARASDLYERALDRTRESFGYDSALGITIRCNFADVLIQRGRYAEAHELVRNAHSVAEALVGADKSQSIFAGIVQARAEMHVGRVTVAVERLRRAEERAESSFGEANFHTWLARWLWADALLAADRPAEARPLAQAVREMADPGTEEHVVASQTLGDALVALGRADEALPILEAALREAIEILDEDRYLLGCVQRALGAARAATGDGAGAADCYSAARQHFLAIDPAHPEATELARRLEAL